MLDIIAHRGYWNLENEKNTEKSFRSALELGFGIETDLRDYHGHIVISHDIPDEGCIKLCDFLSICKEYKNQTLAFNIKSDGLQNLITKQLDESFNFFVFDMSVPDTLGYIENDLPFFTRYSDIEPIPSLLEESQGVWFDCFRSNSFNQSMLKSLLSKNKKTILVSPELHGYDYLDYWAELFVFMQNNKNLIDYIGLCTDYPLRAKEYFCDAM